MLLPLFIHSSYTNIHNSYSEINYKFYTSIYSSLAHYTRKFISEDWNVHYITYVSELCPVQLLARFDFDCSDSTWCSLGILTDEVKYFHKYFRHENSEYISMYHLSKLVTKVWFINQHHSCLHWVAGDWQHLPNLVFINWYKNII